MEKTIDDLKIAMNDSIIKNHYYEGCIPMTTAKIDFNGFNEPYECCCYHFMGITLNIKNHFNDEEKCSICLNKWDLRNNEIIKLSCNHYFHKDCILDWFSCDGGNSCPICRCSHDSCLTAERQLALDIFNDEVYNRVIIPNNSTTVETDLAGVSNTVINNNEEAIVAVITHILPFSINEAVTVNNHDGEGHIASINSDGTYDVKFGDGEIGQNIPRNEIKAVAIVAVITHILPFSINEAVTVNNHDCEGHITSINSNGTYDVKFDDGEIGHNIPRNEIEAIIAVVTHILPFSVNSIQKYTISTLLAKDFTVSSVISEILYNKLKDTRGVNAEIDEPTFYITIDNDIYMSDKYVVLPVSFPYIYYKNSFTTNNEWVPTYGKTPIILVKFKIINFIQDDLLLISKYDLSKNCIEAVKTVQEFDSQPIYSLMKVEKYTKEQYLIPYAYIKKTEVNIELLGGIPSFDIINIIPPS